MIPVVTFVSLSLHQTSVLPVETTNPDIVTCARQFCASPTCLSLLHHRVRLSTNSIRCSSIAAHLVQPSYDNFVESFRLDLPCVSNIHITPLPQALPYTEDHRVCAGWLGRDDLHSKNSVGNSLAIVGQYLPEQALIETGEYLYVSLFGTAPFAHSDMLHAWQTVADKC